MRTIFLSLFITSLILSLPACHKSSGGSSGTPAPGVYEQYGYAGDWAGKCLAENKGEGSRTDLKYIGNNYLNIFSRFETSECADNDLYVTYYYKYSASRHLNAPDLEGWDSFDYSTEAVEAVLHKDWIKDRFNQLKRYGLDGWGLEETKDISGKKFDDSSDPTITKGDIRVSTMKITDDVLYRAKYDKGTALADQPTEYTKK